MRWDLESYSFRCVTTHLLFALTDSAAGEALRLRLVANGLSRHIRHRGPTATTRWSMPKTPTATSRLRWPPHLSEGARVLEVGAGTGRVTRILQALGMPVFATEPAEAMLRQAIELSRPDGGGAEAGDRWPEPGGGRAEPGGRWAEPLGYARAEAAHLPVRPGSFDATVAGWGVRSSDRVRGPTIGAP